jgi:protein-disulfide isomerase
MRFEDLGRASIGAVLVVVMVPSAARSEEPKVAVATFGGTTLYTTDVDAKARKELFQIRVQEYEARLRALNAMIAEELLQKEAAARKLSTDELVEREVLEKAEPVTPAEIQTSYDAVRARFGDKPEAEVKAQIERELKERHAGQRRQAYLKELRDKANVEVLLDPPRLAVEASGGVARGPEDAPVTIVEFSDFQCPYCVRAAPIVSRVLEAYKDKVRFVYRDLPLAIHPFAIKASEAAACAGEQGRFWEMHDRLFAANGKLSLPELKQYAAELKLDGDAFSSCLDSGKTAASWQSGKQAAERYGVSGTPAFFVNGRYFTGARAFETFAEIIDDELARAARARAAKAAN